MHASSKALSSCVAVAESCGLHVDDAVVLHNSNRLAVLLLPIGVLARVAPRSRQRVAGFEVRIAQCLSGTEAPLATLDPRFDPRVYEHGEFVVTFWTYHEPVAPIDIEPREFAGALARLHAGMRDADLSDMEVPHFLDRVAEAQGLVDDPAGNPSIAGSDRRLLATVLRDSSRAIIDRGATEQLVHGEPHPGNLLRTAAGLLFVDLETCCRGPVEFDLAHATTDVGGPPTELCAHYVGADEALVRECWILSLAMATAWRCEPGDDLPNGSALAKTWIARLRATLAS